MRKHALSCLLMLQALMVQADYAAEFRAAANTETWRWDNNAFFTVDDSKRQGALLSADLFFYDVMPKGPLAESAYLQRAGYLRLSGSEQSVDYHNAAARDGSDNVAAIKAHIVIEDMIIWDIRAGQKRSGDVAGLEVEDHAQLHFGIGSYFLDTHSLIVSLQYNNLKHRNTSRLDTRGILVDYKSVLALGRQYLAFGGGVGLHWGEYDKRYRYQGLDVEVAKLALNGFVTYYPIENLGLHLGVNLYTQVAQFDDALDTLESDVRAQLNLGVRYFPVQWLALDMNMYAATKRLAYEDDNTDEDILGRLRGAELGLTVRF